VVTTGHLKMVASKWCLGIESDDGQHRQQQAPSSRQRRQQQMWKFVDGRIGLRVGCFVPGESSGGRCVFDVTASDVGVTNNFVFDTDSGVFPMEVSSKKKRKKDRWTTQLSKNH
jgi:hypothetical protein